MKSVRMTSVVVLSLGTAFSATPVFAQGVAGAIKGGIDASAGAYKTSSNATIYDIVSGLINIGLSLTGVLLLVYLLYAGFLWMTAGGDTKQVGSAKDIIQNAVIGLVVIFSAYAIANFVLTTLANLGSGAEVTTG